MLISLFSQMSLYGPESPDWLQGRHDFKKTGKSAWKCNNPAIADRLWNDRTSSDCFGQGGNNVVNVVMDVNGDGVNEVLGAGNYTCPFISIGIRLRTYPANSSSYLWQLYWNNSASNTDANLDAFMAGAITNSGRRLFSVDYKEGFFGSPKRYFTAVSVSGGSGSVIYQKQDCSNDNPCSSGLTVADVNNDGCPEIYRGVNNRAVAINGCSNSYSEIWNYDLGNTVGIPVIGKIDNDPDWDIAFPVAPNIINVRRASDGAFKFSYTLPSNFPNLLDYDFYSNVLTAYDIDNDGKDELIVRTGSQLLALKYNGSSFNVLWSSNYSTGSAIAIGPILNGNNLGIAVNSSGSLLIIDASNGSLVASTSNAYCGAPTITDINGDGVWDVLISECSCGNPTGYSRTNGFSSPIWQAGGCAEEPPISSDLIVAKYYLNPDNTGKMVIVEGDFSCDTNVWMCDAAEFPTPIEVKENISYSKGYLKIENYKGFIEIYNLDGKKIYKVFYDKPIKLNLKDGLYLLKTENKTYKILLKKEVKQ